MPLIKIVEAQTYDFSYLEPTASETRTLPEPSSPTRQLPPDELDPCVFESNPRSLRSASLLQGYPRRTVRSPHVPS
jgi:hypothetical protein